MQDIVTLVPYHSVIRELASNDEIGEELHKLMTMRTRVFIVHMSAELGSRLFTKAKEIGMMSKGYVWIMTDGITSLLSSVDPSVLESMEGVLGVKIYVPKTEELEKFIRDYQTIENADLNVFGLWDYDTAWALAIAVEVIGTTIFGFDNSDTQTPNNSTCLENFGLSQTGTKLRDALSIIKFRGLSGKFNLVNGQLQSSTFEIINVNDNVERRVAFWTQQNGLNRKQNWTNVHKNIFYSDSQ
nr:glutamate receptor 2.2 [Quercus suber]